MATPCQNQLDAQILSNPYLLTMNQYQKQNESKLLLLTITKLLHHILHNREILIQNKNILNKLQEQQTQINHIQQIKENNNNHNTTILEELSAAFSCVRGDVHEMASTIVNSDEYAEKKIKVLLPKMFQCFERNMTNNIIRHTNYMAHTIYNNVNNTANTSQQTQPPPNKHTDQPLNIANSRNDNKKPSQTNNTTAAPIHLQLLTNKTQIKKANIATKPRYLYSEHNSTAQNNTTTSPIKPRSSHIKLTEIPNEPSTTNEAKLIPLDSSIITDISTDESINITNNNITKTNIKYKPQLKQKISSTKTTITKDIIADKSNIYNNEPTKTPLKQLHSHTIPPAKLVNNITSKQIPPKHYAPAHSAQNIQNKDAICDIIMKKEPQSNPELNTIKVNPLTYEFTNITDSKTIITKDTISGVTHSPTNEPLNKLNLIPTELHNKIESLIPSNKPSIINPLREKRKLLNKPQFNRNIINTKQKKKKIKNNNKQKNKIKKHQKNKKRSKINKKNKNNLNNNKKQLIPFKIDEIENKNQLNNFKNDELEKYIINYKFTDDQFDDWTDYKMNIKKNITAKEYYELLNGKITDTLIKQV